MGDAKHFQTVLEAERAEIEKRRKKVGNTKGAELVGLAFSGGGIRSATFNLGILQALASLGMLWRCDYLSTVSGGGYIGSWLTAWIRRAGFAQVNDALARDEQPSAIHFLRQYSNYLTPRVGLFHADTWTMAAIYLRNLILNQSVLIAALAAVLLLPRFMVLPAVMLQSVWRDDRSDGTVQTLAGIVILFLLPACIFIGRNLDAFSHSGGQPRPKYPRFANQGAVQALIALPVSAAAWLGSIALWLYSNPNRDFQPAGLSWPWFTCAATTCAFFLFLGWRGRISRCVPLSTPRRGLRIAGLLAISSAVPALVSVPLFWMLARFFHGWLPNGPAPWHVVTWGPPLLIVVFTLLAILHMAMLGIYYPDERREWWSRLGAWLAIYCLVWIALFWSAIYAPLFLTWGWFSFKTLAAGISVGWLLTTVAGVVAGRGGATSPLRAGDSGASRAAELLAKAAPHLFVVGLVLAISFALHLSLPCMGSPAAGACVAWNDLTALAADRLARYGDTLPLGAIEGYHWELLKGLTPHAAALLAALIGVALLLAWRVDINEFSMHHFYRNRLVRAYLGASRRREPQPFTGFDSKDDIHLADLTVADGYEGPYPLINTALNLVSGNELAWQQRRAAPFLFSPLYCGYDLGADPAYRPTEDYAYPNGPSLGTSVAISGAAASPNMGYHSSAPVAFLMTMFNVRLGWWLGNPNNEISARRPGPPFALRYLIMELLGMTNEKSNYVYLSDGGHFENLGIYELVRRKCRYIIACDAGQDGAVTFDDLGGAIRKCRTDLDVEISIELDSIRHSPEKRSAWHCAVGRIDYDDYPGTLIYLKASLTGDEEADVLNYGATRAAFPHEPTSDQWFDESQFESYRRLGMHVARSTFGKVTGDYSIENGDEEFFVRLREAWHPPTRVVAASFVKHAEALDGIMHRLATDEKLRFLDDQIYPEWRYMMRRAAKAPPRQMWAPADYDQIRAGFYFCSSLIQLMEDVYLDLNLESDHSHPDHRGWLNLFKHWSWSGMFRVTWAVCASTCGARFQTFCRRHLDLNLGAIEVRGVASNSQDLNFLELELVEELLKNRESRQDVTIYVLQAVIEDKTLRAPVPETETLRLPFGFAVVLDEKLLFFRVQDHLRKMGLAREALRKLLANTRVTGLSTTPLPARVQQFSTEDDRHHLERIFRSVRRDEDPPPLASAAGQA